MSIKLDMNAPLPEEEKSLWDKANTPLIDLRGSGILEGASEEFKKNHPYLATAENFGIDTVSSMSSPLSLGLMLATGGAGTLAKAGITTVPKTILHMLGKGIAAGTVAHGGYKAVTADTGPEALGGALEAGVGGLGLLGGGKKGPPALPTLADEFKGTEGAKKALQFLRSKSENVEPGDPDFSRYIAAQKALDEHTLRNRRGEVAQQISGKEGRPEVHTTDPATTRGLRIASRGLSIVDSDNAYQSALDMDARKLHQQRKSKQQEWKDEAANEEARLAYIEKQKKLAALEIARDQKNLVDVQKWLEKKRAAAQKQANSDAAANLLVQDEATRQAAAAKKAEIKKLSDDLYNATGGDRASAKVAEQAEKQRRKIEIARDQADTEQTRRDAAGQKQDNSDAATDLLVQDESARQADAAKKAELKKLNDDLYNATAADASVTQLGETAAEQAVIQAQREKAISEGKVPVVSDPTTRITAPSPEGIGTDSLSIRLTTPPKKGGAAPEGGGGGGGSSPGGGSPPDGTGGLHGNVFYTKGDALKFARAGGLPPTEWNPVPVKGSTNWALERINKPSDAAINVADPAYRLVLETLVGGRFSNKLKADAIASRIPGATVFQHGPKNYSVKLPEDYYTPSPPPPEPPDPTPLQIWDAGGPPPPEPPGGWARGNYSSLGPGGKPAPHVPHDYTNSTSEIAKRAGLTEDEIARYYAIMPVKNGPKLNPAERAEWDALDSRINSFRNKEIADAKAAAANSKSESTIGDYTGTAAHPTPGEFPTTIDVPVPETPPVSEAPKGPKPAPTSNKLAEMDSTGLDEFLAAHPDYNQLPDDVTPNVGDARSGSMGQGPPIPPKTVPPQVNAVGETEPTLPGVIPVVNPDAKPVAEAPFSLTRQVGKSAPPPTGDLPTMGSSAPRSAADLAREMSDLQAVKPRPIKKLYGSKGPTPDQLKTWEQEMREWNRKYRAASNQQKLALDRDNAAFRAAAPVEPVAAAPVRFFKTPLEAAGENYGQVKAAKAAGENVPEEGRRTAARAAQRLNKESKAAAAAAPAEPPKAAAPASVEDAAIAEVEQQLQDPNVDSLTKTVLQRWLDNFKKSRLAKDESGVLNVERRLTGPEQGSNGGRSALPPGELATFINNLRRATLLNPYSVAKKGIGDVQSLVTAGIENPSKAGNIVRSLFSPETVENFKAGWDAPTAGMEDANTSGVFYSRKNPLGWSGRTMSGLTSATKGVLENAGLTPDEARAYTLTATPSRGATAPLYELFNKPVFNHLNPFSRIALNWAEQGYTHSPFGLLDLMKNDLSPTDKTSILKKAALGTGAGAAAYALTPDDFVKEHPTLAHMITAGPLGAPILGGMALKSTATTPINEAVSTLLDEIPGMRLVEDLRGGLKGFVRNYISSYTNVGKPFADFSDPDKRDLYSKDLELWQQLLNKALNNIPGLRQTLPVYEEGGNDPFAFMRNE